MKLFTFSIFVLAAHLRIGSAFNSLRAHSHEVDDIAEYNTSEGEIATYEQFTEEKETETTLNTTTAQWESDTKKENSTSMSDVSASLTINEQPLLLNVTIVSTPNLTEKKSMNISEDALLN